MMPVPIPQTVRLSSLLQGLVEFPAEFDREISGIELDSRRVTSGTVFMACKGIKSDGRKFIPEAIRRGSAAVLVEKDERWNCTFSECGIVVIPVSNLLEKMHLIAARFFGEPAAGMRIIGITGTNGKTSCSKLLAELLTALGVRCGLVGTLGYGMACQELQIDYDGPGTTPDAVKAQRILAELKQKHADTVVMEVSSHGLEQHRLNVNDFAIAVFTNLSRDHLDMHGTMDAYGEVKRSLFAGANLQIAVLNKDDAYSNATTAILRENIKCRTWSLHDSSADIYAKNLVLNHSGFSMVVVSPWGEFAFSSPLLGRFNVSNILAVLCTALESEAGKENFNARHIVDLAQKLLPVQGRMQLVGDFPVTVVVDYAHTPDGLEQALLAVREHCSGRLHCVFGCGGERDKGKRPLMAAVAEKLADNIIVTNDNPRHEDGSQIIADILAGLSDKHCAQIISDREVAIAAAIAQASPGDLILVAGKGHEDYQEVAGIRTPFSDCDHALKVLQQHFAERNSAESNQGD